MAALVQGLRGTLALSARVFRTVAPKAAVCGLQQSKIHTKLWNGPQTASLLVSNQLGRILFRSYADKKLSMDEIKERVMKVIKDFDKITAEQLTVDSHFINDLGLDSLDHVEVIMAMEDEFGFEIPDGDAEKLARPADIIRYVADKEEVYD